jgi:hypothetical protein
MTVLDDQQKEDLENMISANETEDVTEDIRSTKKSERIHADINHLLHLKKKYFRLAKSNPKEFDAICIKQCDFLYNSFAEIFKGIKTDTIDINIMYKFLDVLKKIEDGEIDQHEGSYLVGKHLKEIYVDSALRVQQKKDSNNRRKKGSFKPKSSTETETETKPLSYREFKNSQK